MGRVIIFDKHTGNNLPPELALRAEQLKLVRSKLRDQRTMEWIVPILQEGQRTVFMLPSAHSGEVRIVQVRHFEKHPVEVVPQIEVVEPEYEATGFLGLTDVHLAETETEPQPEQPPRKWWKRWWS